MFFWIFLKYYLLLLWISLNSNTELFKRKLNNKIFFIFYVWDYIIITTFLSSLCLPPNPCNISQYISFVALFQSCGLFRCKLFLHAYIYNHVHFDSHHLLWSRSVLQWADMSYCHKKERKLLLNHLKCNIYRSLKYLWWPTC